MWCVACGVWCVACGVWCVACGVWRVVCGVWHGSGLGWPRAGRRVGSAREVYDGVWWRLVAGPSLVWVRLGWVRLGWRTSSLLRPRPHGPQTPLVRVLDGVKHELLRRRVSMAQQNSCRTFRRNSNAGESRRMVELVLPFGSRPTTAFKGSPPGTTARATVRGSGTGARRRDEFTDWPRDPRGRIGTNLAGPIARRPRTSRKTQFGRRQDAIIAIPRRRTHPAVSLSLSLSLA